MEALTQAIFFHKIINFLLIIVTFLAFLANLIVRDFGRFHKIIWFITPLFLGFLGLGLFSIISILAMQKFQDSALFVIVFTTIIILACEIWRIKKMRVARGKPSTRENYMRISKILNLAYLALLYANTYCYEIHLS